MSDRETNLRCVLFLFLGSLMLFSILFCFYLINSEKDLVRVEAVVTEVDLPDGEDGKRVAVLTYDVQGETYEKRDYETKDKITTTDKVIMYYYPDAPSETQFKKTSYAIFITPVAGVLFCIAGLVELYRKPKKDGEEFKTQVVRVVEKPVVQEEPKVIKVIQKPEVAEEKTSVVVSSPKKEEVKIQVKEEPKVEEVKPPVNEEVRPIIKIIEKTEPKVAPAPKVEEVKIQDKEEPKVEEVKSEPISVEAVSEVKEDSVQEVKKVEMVEAETEVKPVVNEEKVQQTSGGVEDAILKKIQANDSSMDDDEIKQVIKDMLKEVIQEVSEEKEPPKKVEQRRVLPNYFYISGTSLIYEEPGKDAKEIQLDTVKKVVRTVNSEGNVVKLIVSNEEVKCILTNMKNIDLEQVASLLHNKMRVIDETFKEEIEYKEY